MTKRTRKLLSDEATIRLATEEDLPGILELYNKLHTDINKVELSQVDFDSQHDYRRIFAEICAVPGHQLLVVEYNGEFVATMVLIIMPNLSYGGRPWAIMDNLILRRGYGGLGFGRMLLKYAKSQAEKMDCYKIDFIVRKNLPPEAYRHFRLFGFRALKNGFRLYV
jgi:N-acetylglutamate synthase-like GNAT family acetyltransferase